MANIWYLQVNRFCNQLCHFCSNPSNGKNISYEEGIDLINDFKVKNYSWLIFTWWEPTLSPDLHRWITYASSINLDSRVISNGMMLSDLEYTKKLKKSWLKLVHLSLHSYKEQIHDFLTWTPGSYKKLLNALRNCTKLGIEVNINTVINHYNEDHLDKNVMFLVKYFPQIHHFVWNNLDPFMMRKSKIALTTLPSFDWFRDSLYRAMLFLNSNNKTFRAERVPLCYMSPFVAYSTETRKIIKEEKRRVHFLDERDIIEQKWSDFYHDKLDWCKSCSFNDICAGIYEHDKFYNYVQVYPQKYPKKIIEKIKKLVKEVD